MSARDKDVSKSDRTYFEPLTVSGFPLTGGEVTPLRLHECGARVMDERWNYRAVRSPFWRAYYNLDSGAAVRALGRKWPLGPDRLVLLPEGVLYDCVPGGAVRHCWVHFSPGGPAAAPLASEPLVVMLTPVERQLWADLYRRVCEAQAGEAGAVRHAVAGALLMSWARVPELAPQEGTPRLRQLLEWVERRLSRPPSVGAMASEAGLCVRAFLRWFKQETGRTPAHYLTERRVIEACRRLRFTAESIDQIAEATGFTNRHHFSRVFKARTGRTPADYRKG